MYATQSLQDILFLILYGGVAMLALVAGIYMGLRRNNGIISDVNSSSELRCWTAAFFIMSALSHVWWYVLGVYWLTDDRLVRNIVAVNLDHIALVPLVMALLLRMLQDRRRRIWPWVLTQLPIAVFAGVGIATHDGFYGFDVTTYWQVAVMVVFVAYYIHALIRYGRWLRHNYADLEHKEVWQSLLFVVVLFLVYEVYFTNPGVMSREYLAQFNTIVIIVFLLWRVESLQQLDDVKEDDEGAIVVEAPTEADEAESANSPIPSNIGALLHKYCETPGLYLQHDLTLAQLSECIGTNRTYLGTYFVQQGITYNVYINRLRIEYFEQAYIKAIDSDRPFTAQQLAFKCGFRSYSTFSSAFKQFKGQTVTAWMKSQSPED